jgi:hypothetical protein
MSTASRYCGSVRRRPRRREKRVLRPGNFRLDPWALRPERLTADGKLAGCGQRRPSHVPKHDPEAQIAAPKSLGLAPFPSEISGLHEPGLRHSPPFLSQPPPNQGPRCSRDTP